MSELKSKIAETLLQPVYSELMESVGDAGIRMHFHNCYEIILVLSGQVVYTIAGKQYAGEPGTLFFISNLEEHEVKIVRRPYIRIYLLIRPEYIQNITREPVLLSIFRYRPESFSHKIQLCGPTVEEVDTAFRRMNAEVSEKADFWEDAVKSQLKLFLIRLYRNHSGSFPMKVAGRAQILVLRVQEYIELHCSESLELKDIAATFFTDMYYLSRLFKKHTGYSYKEYVILQRMARAKELLLNTDFAVTRVCSDSGFNNINHFIRIFSQRTGMSPLKYRKAAQSRQNG